MADKTMWRGQSATLTIGNLQGFTKYNKHIKSYTFDVFNGNTPVNDSFTDAGDSTSYSRSITTSEHVASGNDAGYTDYTVKGYLKYTHTAYDMQTTATSNTVTKSLRVQEPLDTESLTGFSISPTAVWSNFLGEQNITIKPSFAYTPFSKSAEISCSQASTALGGGSNGASSLELKTDGTSHVIYKNTNTTKDLGTQSKNIEFYVYSIANTSAAEQKLLYSRSLLVKNAVTGLSISESLTTYNNAGLWDPKESVKYTPGIPFSKEVSLVHETTDDAYPENTITQNGISVTLNSTTGAFTFNVSQAQDVSKTSEFKFRVKSIQGQNPVYSNVMTFTVHGFTASRKLTVVEGETFTIDNLGIGRIDSTGIPSNLEHVTVTTTADNLGIEITGKAVSTNQTETFTITSTSGSQVTINCLVEDLFDIAVSINTGDTTTFTAADIKRANSHTSINSITGIIIGPDEGKGTAYVSDGELIYYAPTSPIGNEPIDVPITVATDTGASAVIHIKVVDITMTIE